MQGTIIRRRMPTKLITPAMTLSYGTEMLVTTKRQENGIKVNEMRMYGVTSKDKIGNEHL